MGVYCDNRQHTNSLFHPISGTLLELGIICLNLTPKQSADDTHRCLVKCKLIYFRYTTHEENPVGISNTLINWTENAEIFTQRTSFTHLSKMFSEPLRN